LKWFDRRLGATLQSLPRVQRRGQHVAEVTSNVVAASLFDNDATIATLTITSLLPSRGARVPRPRPRCTRARPRSHTSVSHDTLPRDNDTPLRRASVGTGRSSTHETRARLALRDLRTVQLPWRCRHRHAGDSARISLRHRPNVLIHPQGARFADAARISQPIRGWRKTRNRSSLAFPS
jgi:hypothetical protein